MQRDILLLTEMIDAAEQAHQLTAGITIGQLETDRQRRDALLWNFTVLGEAAGQLCPCNLPCHALGDAETSAWKHGK